MSAWSDLSIGWKLSYRTAGVSPQLYNAVARGRTQPAATAELRRRGKSIQAPSYRPPAADRVTGNGLRSRTFYIFGNATTFASVLPAGSMVLLKGHGVLHSGTTQYGSDFHGEVGWATISPGGADPSRFTDATYLQRLRQRESNIFQSPPTQYKVEWKLR